MITQFTKACYPLRQIDQVRILSHPSLKSILILLFNLCHDFRVVHLSSELSVKFLFSPIRATRPANFSLFQSSRCLTPMTCNGAPHLPSAFHLSAPHKPVPKVFSNVSLSVQSAARRNGAGLSTDITLQIRNFPTSFFSDTLLFFLLTLRGKK